LDTERWKDPLEDRLRDLVKASREAEKIDRGRAEAFGRMVSTDAWSLYVSLLNAKIQMFSDVLLSPSGGLDGCIAQEWVKGAMFGLLLARDTPSTTITAMREARLAGPEDDDDDSQ